MKSSSARRLLFFPASRSVRKARSAPRRSPPPPGCAMLPRDDRGREAEESLALCQSEEANQARAARDSDRRAPRGRRHMVRRQQRPVVRRLARRHPPERDWHRGSGRSGGIRLRHRRPLQPHVSLGREAESLLGLSLVLFHSRPPAGPGPLFRPAPTRHHTRHHTRHIPVRVSLRRPFHRRKSLVPAQGRGPLRRQIRGPGRRRLGACRGPRPRCQSSPCPLRTGRLPTLRTGRLPTPRTGRLPTPSRLPTALQDLDPP